MKKLILSILLMFLILPSVAKAELDTEAFSANFKSALASKSPLSPPDHFTTSLTPLINTSVFDNAESFRDKMRGKKLTGKDLKPTKNRALVHTGRVEDLISNRQTKTEAKIVSASRSRLDSLVVAIDKDLESGMVKINKMRAESVARADRDKRIQRTVLDIKMESEILVCDTSINQARARLKKGGLTAQTRKKIIASINSWKARKDSLEKKWSTEKGKIENAHISKVKAADSELSLNSKTLRALYDQNLKTSEESVNQENAEAVKYLNNQIYIDSKKLDSLKNSLERVLTGVFDRIVQLGGSATPKKIKPKKQKVSSKKKQAAKNKAAKKGRDAGAKHLKKYRELLLSELD